MNLVIPGIFTPGCGTKRVTMQVIDKCTGEVGRQGFGDFLGLRERYSSYINV